jgi:fatty acid omega-hydroxylase
VKGANFHSIVRDLLGNGIFAVDGDAWKQQRRVASHMFSARSFRETIMAAFVRHGVELDAIMARHAASGQPLDISSLYFRFTLDSIGDIAFGKRLGVMAQPSVPFALAFDDAQATVEKRFFIPGWQVLRWVMPSEARLRRSVATLNAFCAELIAERRAAGDAEARFDVLSRFMALRDDATGEKLYEHDDSMLRDVVLNFLIAGRDTTAQALSWATYCILQHPEVEARIVAEVAGITSEPEAQAAAAKDAAAHAHAASGTAVSAGDVFAPSYDTVSHEMRYTTATVMETLRLYPSVPKDIKEALADDVLPDGTKIPAGSVVAYLPYSMGRNEQLWPEPLRFDPGRFLGDGAKHSPFKFIAFNAGPRTCLGQHMAQVEATYVLATILRKYKLTTVPGQTITYTDSLTLPMQQGLMVTVARR